ncbi:sigma factor [Microbacterium sp. BR1]|uniref:RNA polymerase sigma factor n=1 Tax=Microbacterium sp. BR1 TaxID=1070896 RepID=UPI000C2C2EF4
MRRAPLPQELRDWIEVVVDDNADDVLRYLRRRVAEPEEAADLLGHVLLALWQNGSRVPTSDTDARMWCFGIARNVLREHFRHTVKRLALADELRDQLRDTTLHGNAADTTAEASMRASEVRKAVASLDRRSRENFVKRSSNFGNGFSSNRRCCAPPRDQRIHRPNALRSRAPASRESA